MPTNRTYVVRDTFPTDGSFLMNRTADAEVFISTQKGYRLNCWGMITRQNECIWSTTTRNIDAHFVVDELEKLSCRIHKPTYVVMDNASIHHAKIIKERIPFWQKRGLYIFYLPPYCPHLNIAETMWRHLKGGWLQADDYLDNENLAYAVNRCMANIGKNLNIKFKCFNAN